MPLEATHIKFALDNQNKYHIQDLSKYLSGSVYPDSRYVTKISRELTHNDNLLSPDFGVDDFKKGWANHFLCDKLWNQVIDNNFSMLIDTFCPNGEPVEQVKEYYKMIRELYVANREVTIDDLKQMWVRLGIGDELAEKVTEKSEEYAGKPELVKKIQGQYKEMCNLSLQYE